MDIDNSLKHEEIVKEIKEREFQEDIKNTPHKSLEQEVEFKSNVNGVDRIRYIQDYDYVPYEYVKHSLIGQDDNLYLGFELEVDGGGKVQNNAKKVIDMLGEDCCFCVHDGSLEEGFEIVTNPSTLGFHKSQPYEQILKFLKMKGYKDCFTAGLHIHINRDFFGDDADEVDLNIIKLIYLIENNWNYTKVIARRENKHYAQRLDGVDSMIKLYAQSKMIGKMACVNLEHTNSIELRLFASTTNLTTLIGTLEYVRNLAYISRDTKLDDIQNITFENIVKYKPTEYLLKYCENRKIQF